MLQKRIIALLKKKQKKKHRAFQRGLFESINLFNNKLLHRLLNLALVKICTEKTIKGNICYSAEEVTV